VTGSNTLGGGSSSDDASRDIPPVSADDDEVESDEESDGDGLPPGWNRIDRRYSNDTKTTGNVTDAWDIYNQEMKTRDTSSGGNSSSGKRRETKISERTARRDPSSGGNSRSGKRRATEISERTRRKRDDPILSKLKKRFSEEIFEKLQKIRNQYGDDDDALVSLITLGSKFESVDQPNAEQKTPGSYRGNISVR
jgi:hypothetical protein